MSHAQALWSDFPPFPLPQQVPSLQNPSHSVEHPCAPRTGGRSGRLAEQSPPTGYEPNVTVEVISAEVTPVLLSSRRASFCSAFDSGEDVTTTPVSSEVDERQSMDMLAPPLLVQKSAASAVPARFYHCKRESSMSGSSRIASAGRPVAM